MVIESGRGGGGRGAGRGEGGRRSEDVVSLDLVRCEDVLISLKEEVERRREVEVSFECIV